jgi:hypothetical protein
MEIKIYNTNRDGRPYPAIEIDVIDILDRYLQNCDIEEFVHEYIGQEKFLEYAVDAIKNTYANKVCSPNIMEARGELLKAMGEKYLEATASACASIMNEEQHYRTEYFKLYHALNDASNWDNFYELKQAMKGKFPNLIGSSEWLSGNEHYRKEVLGILKSKLDEVNK